MPTRHEMWERLGGTVDVLVLGGGINGAGIARDAARRGLDVALVEMRDLAFGTSSRSSKLVHGGLRYLEQMEFSLVFEAVSERRILMDIAPHLVNPLGFLFPIYKGSRHKLWTINAGMWLYDGLSLFRSPKLHRTLKASEVRNEEPALRSSDISGAPLYYDCSTDDARLTLESALDAAHVGAVVATWTRAVELLRDDEGRLCGAVVECQLTGDRKEVRAHAIVNATGPWTDQTMALAGRPSHLLRPTKGVHIVVPASKLPVRHAVVCFHPDDGRVLFAIPWGESTYIGTTDTDFDGDPALVAATSDDVDYLLDACRTYFPGHPLDRVDVCATWAGLRPLMAPVSKTGDVDESAVSREHRIEVGRDGMITIAGGKLTTYRKMSEEVVDTAVKLLRLSGRVNGKLPSANTDREPLPGAVGWPSDDDHDRVADAVRRVAGQTIGADTARYLTDTYGMRAMDLARRVRAQPELGERLVPGRPEIRAQVLWAMERELAATVSDFMVRRTQLFYKDLDQGLSAVDRVVADMGDRLGWSAAERERMRVAYLERVERSRAWRSKAK